MVDRGKPGVNSRDEGEHNGRNVGKMMWMVDERASVTKDEERVLRGG